MGDLHNSDRPKPDATKWVERYGDQLFSYALSRLGNTHDAEEVVQETLFAGVRSIDDFRGEGTENSWLINILRNKIVDFVRVRNRRRESEMLENSELSLTDFDNMEIVSFAKNPIDIASERELWQTVRNTLNHLPQLQSDAFVLREFEGLSAEAICRVLRISKSNLWVLLHRARIGIAAELTRYSANGYHERN